ncbi:MAG: glycoside hydrolase [Halobacteriales archaeon]|nr:glycoside hydrolase [Halobacteriales archaeon]
MRSLLPALLLCLALLAGCAQPPAAPPEPPAPAPPMEMRVLPNATAPAGDLVAATYRAGKAVGTGFLGEPTLVADAWGRLLLTFPGCEGSHSQCLNAPIFRSADGGASWESLNRLRNGSLDPGSPRANGDAMLSIDAAGALYASNLGSGLPHWRSVDDGATWEYRGNPVPKGAGSDRQWSWGGPNGTVVTAWMATSPARAAAVAVSHDGGSKWTKPATLDASIGWIGPIAGSPDGQRLLVAYTKPLNSDQPVVGGVLLPKDPQVELRLLRSLDGGATWGIVGTGHVITKDPAVSQWSGTLMAPALARTGDGTLVYAWSEQRLDPEGRAASTVASVYTMASKDDGATWGAPRLLSGDRTAIMPWVVGGAGGRYAVGYYAASDVHVDSDYEGTWDMEATVVDGERAATAVVAAKVHSGGICTKGGGCSTSDRSMLDFLGGALLPDGRVAWAYASSAGIAADPRGFVLGGDGTSVLVAVQDGGSRLL